MSPTLSPHPVPQNWHQAVTATGQCRPDARGGIGLESKHAEYIDALLGVFAQVHRVLKPAGSFWLNIGDAYDQKNLLGLPWRVALALTDRQGWVLRNDVIWHKVKGGPDNAKDKLRNVHEHVFHFVKQRKDCYYNTRRSERSRSRRAS